MPRFRQDLYYRLNVVAIEVPSLRQRREDIPLLANHFLQRFAERNRKAVKGFTPQAMDLLIHYDWREIFVNWKTRWNGRWCC